MDNKNRITHEETRLMQKYILDLLLAIDKVCRDHHLNYYLLAGTMLGAVRHKGFIPWDDDADIALPREDYDKLLEHADEWLPERYELVSGNTDPMYPYQFARIQDHETTYILRRQFDYIGGLPVDVFPLDGMTEKTWKRRWHYMRYGVVKKLLYFSTVNPNKHGHGIKSILPRIMHMIVSQQWAHRKSDNIQREYSGRKASLVADHDNAPSRGILPRQVYGTPTPIEFEGHMLMGVQEPDTYLSYCYGDYMRMPKEYPPQNFRYLDLRKPYREYIKEKSRQGI